jgi:hypothetical protein
MLTIDPLYYIDRRFVPLKTFLEDWSPLLDEIDIHQKIVFRRNYHGSKPWNVQKQEQYIDSLLRGFYTPNLVVREISELTYYAWEVFDGKQRIETIRQFVQLDKKKKHIEIPRSLQDIPEFAALFSEYPNKTALSDFYRCEIPSKIWKHIRDMRIEVHIIQGIGNDRDRKNQKIANKLFKFVRNI